MTLAEKSRCVNAPQPNSAARNDTVFCEQKSIRVYCCHSTPLILSGIVAQLATSPQIQIIGKTACTDEMLVKFKRFKEKEWPDIIILDANAKPTNGVTAYIEVSLMKPSFTEIMMLDNDNSLKNSVDFFWLHASHYVQSTTDTNLVEAVNTIAKGKQYVHISARCKKVALDWFDWVLQDDKIR